MWKEWSGEDREDDSPREEIEGGKEEDPFDSPSSSLAAMSVCLAHGERGHSYRTSQDNSILLYQVVPSASKIEAEILREFELNLDHPGGK